MKTNRREFLQLLAKGVAASAALGAVAKKDNQKIADVTPVDPANTASTALAFSAGGNYATCASFSMKPIGWEAMESSRKSMVEEE